MQLVWNLLGLRVKRFTLKKQAFFLQGRLPKDAKFGAARSNPTKASIVRKAPPALPGLWLIFASLLLALLPVRLAAASATVLGWNNLGMHCMDSDYSLFSILPPYNTIEAQLIVNGKLLTNGTGYSITYEAVADPDGSFNSWSFGKGNFYDFTGLLYGPLAPEMGLAGWAMPGLANQPQGLLFEKTNQPVAGVFTPVNWWRAEGIPITPYDDQGNKNPYPLFHLVARNGSGAIIAQSDIVLPVSDEMDCTACHGDAAHYRENILQLHDAKEFARNSANYASALAAMSYKPEGLHATAVQGQPILCAKCHSSEALGTKSYGAIPALTTSMHSLHAGVTDPVTLTSLGAADNRSSCYRCHPGSTTRCLRGAMGSAVAPDGTMAMQCQSCHGNMAAVGSPNRIGWLMEPKCQSCHSGTATHNNGQIRYASVFDGNGQERVPVDQTFATSPNTPAAGLSLYRFSSGHGGLQCSACHGSTHAEFPSSHRNDNIRNAQLQGHAGMMVECTACHAAMPSTVNGGPHGMHPVGQAWVGNHHDLIQQVGLPACQACHGADYRGTVLSRAQGDRTFQLGDGRGTRSFFRGATVGCYSCHQGIDGDSMNQNPPPAIADVSAQTLEGIPVDMILAIGNGNAVLRIISQPANGSVGLSNNVATYFPFDGFVGTDTFTFAAYDGALNSSLATGTVQVRPLAGPPSLPVITGEPLSATVAVGKSVTLSVTAAGTGLSYQWYKEGWPIPNAVAPTLTFTAAAQGDSGTYQALVLSSATAVASAPAVLSVIVPVSITAQPLSQTVTAGASVSLSVSAAGTAPLSYQWAKNGSALSGATGSTLRFSPVGLSNAGDYTVLVSNAAGSLRSDAATLTVLAAPVIVLQPGNVTVVQGSTVTLAASATGYPAPVYQWYNSLGPISGAVASSLVFPSIQPADAGGYYAVALNSLGSVTSRVATITVRVPPPVISGFAPASGPAGTAVTLTGSYFTGASSVSFHGTPAAFTIISAAQINATVPAGSTSGPISVTTPGGTTASAASFTVIPPPRISGLTPASGPVGTLVTFSGSGFNGATRVAFAGVTASFTLLSDAQITATVPAGAAAGPVSVTTPGGTASGPSFTVTLPRPAISSFTPSSGGVGTAVTVTGSNFNGATQVAFNGVPAAFTVISSSAIVAGVPSGASTGPISVTTPGGRVVSSANYQVGARSAAPRISGFTPSSGSIGSVITVTGSNLGAVTTARIGTLSAPCTVVSASQIRLTIPSGATSGFITVATPGGSTTSSGRLTVK